MVPYGCVDPVNPGFEYTEGLIYIDALATNIPGTSYVTVQQTVDEFGVVNNRNIGDATVTFWNSNTGDRVPLTASGGAYTPAEDFAAKPGETWELEVILDNGTVYRSEPETLLQPIPISAADVHYDKEMAYSPEYERYVPGHIISIDLLDPGGEENFYYWRFRSFEKLPICRICFNSINRGECISWSNGPGGLPLMPYYIYYCEPACWRIRYAEEISIFSDSFTDGKEIKSLPVANIPLYTKENIVVELQQFAIHESAHRYLKTLKDLIDNNSSLNAPLPAALVGNLYNPGNREEFVLGRFIAGATTINPTYIERMLIQEEPIDTEVNPVTEGPEAPPFQVYTAPCVEGLYQTAARPAYWPDEDI